ncbi:MAG: fibronectin type III domain-containing protein [Chthoniobacterales bacterium]
MIRLKTGYKDATADGIYHLGSTVSGNLPGLPVFATLKPTAAQIAAATLAVDAARKMFGPGRKQALKSAKLVLAVLLGDVATNAPQIPDCTDTDLAEIGLPVVKTPVKATNPPGECLNLRFFHDEMPGAIKGRCATLGGTIRVYEAQWALDPNGTGWSDPAPFPNSRAFKFSGLERGKEVWVRVRALNSKGPGPWSDPVCIMVI